MDGPPNKSRLIRGYAQKISENIKNKSWDKSYEKVEKIILREVTMNE